MKTILASALMLGTGICLFAQITFGELIRRNIDHFQASENLSYSLKLETLGGEDEVQTLNQEYIHVYKNGEKQCLKSEQSIMICEGSLMLSILPGEQVMVLQQRSDSFDLKYTEQLFKLARLWEQNEIKELPSAAGNRSFQLIFPENSDYESIELEFHKTSGLMISSLMRLRGAYQMGEKSIGNPAIRMTYEDLNDKKLKDHSIVQYLDNDMKPLPLFKDYTFYNTLQN